MEQRECSFENFVNVVKVTVRDYLPGTEEWRQAEVITDRVDRLSGSYTGLTVRRKGAEVCATANLDELYRACGTIDEAVKKAAEIVQMMPEGLNPVDLKDYGDIKKRLFVRLSSEERNRELLKKVPHRTIPGGIAMTAHILFEGRATAIGSAMVTNSMTESYGMTAEGLLRDALENSERIKPARLMTMDETVAMLLGGIPPELIEEVPETGTGPGEGIPGMLVLTNRENRLGAAAVLYPGMKSRLTNSCFVVPSSVHEMILIEDEGVAEPEGLQEILVSTNENEVMPEDRLSDTLLYWDAASGTLMTAEEHMKKQQTRKGALM